jgi:hypothetical protein
MKNRRKIAEGEEDLTLAEIIKLNDAEAPKMENT